MRHKIWLIIVLAASGFGAQAQDRPAFLGETLAVEIEADEAELSEARDVSTYRGNVRLTRGPLTMRGDELRITRNAESGQIEARLSGNPATASHKTAQDGLPVKASAKQIVYTTIVEILELAGDARIQRGEDMLQGDSVRYDVANARIQADGGNDRVRIVINPPADPAQGEAAQ
ncbi:MAG: lipopolysaccharide transport periplasmic protein LptA [Oceanococcus sp.]